MTNNVDYTIASKKEVPEIALKLRELLSKKGYGILSTIDVQKIMKEKNDEFIEPYIILDVCNPAHAGTAIAKHKEVGLVLPCKVSIYKDGEVTKVSLLRPTEAIRMMGYDDLESLAGSVEDDLQKTIKSIEE